MGILGWQLLILVTIVAAGRSRGIAVIFWVIWTAVQVFALPLSLLQFGTIWLGHTIASALFPHRPSSSDQMPLQVGKPATPPVAKAENTSPESGMDAKVVAEKAGATGSADPVRMSLGELMRGINGGEVKTRALPLPSTSQPKDYAALFREAVKQAKERADTQHSSTSGHSADDLSESLVAYLESLDAGESRKRDVSSGRSDARSSTRTRVDPGIAGALASDARGSAGCRCHTCAEESTRVVSGMRYCSDCGAFVGMQS